jgi:hypothetical protein
VAVAGWYDAGVRTQEEIREEFDRLLEEDRIEEAEALAEQIIPVSREEFRRRLDEAPYDEEPLTPRQQRRVEELRAALAERRLRTDPGRQAS